MTFGSKESADWQFGEMKALKVVQMQRSFQMKTPLLLKLN